MFRQNFQCKAQLKYQGVKEFHMLAHIGCCNFMVFSPFKVNMTYNDPLNQWLLGTTNGNQGQTVMYHQCSETINHYNGYKISNYTSVFKFPIITH